MVPPIRGRTVKGNEVLVKYTAGRRTLSIVIQQYCDFCQDNWLYWRQLSHTAAGRSDAVVLATVSGGLSPDDPNIQSLIGRKKHGRLVALDELSPEVITGFRLHYVPDTIVIGAGGHVLRAVAGVMTKKDFAALNELL